jgi:hypothetical protein
MSRMRTLALPLVALVSSALCAQSRTWNWAWAAGSAGYEEAYVALSPSGALHLLGNYTNSIDAHGTPLTSSGLGDAFVQELDPADGSVMWTAEAHHSSNLAFYDVAYRSTGELVVCGTVQHNGSAIAFGSDALPGQEFGTQAFVAGLSASGQWNWVSGVGGAVSTEGFHVEVDANDRILLGTRWGTDLAVYRFTGAGVQQWEATATSSGSSVDLYAMDVLPGGDVVITGRCYGTGTFGAQSITVAGIFYDAYVARLSSTGTWQWVAQAGGTNWDKGFGVCADAAGDVYVAGTFRNTATFGSTALTATGSNNDGWLAKVNGAGQWQWAVQLGSSAYMEVYGMDLNDAGDRLVLTGNYAFNTPTIGGITLPAPTLNDLYVVEYDTEGQVLGALGAGGAGGDRGMAAVYGAGNTLYLAGSFGADMQLGADLLPCVSTPDLWVGRLEVELSTGWQAVDEAPGELRTWPNPAQDAAVVVGTFDQQDAVELLDMDGRVLRRLAANGTERLMVARDGLAAGTYLLRIHGTTTNAAVRITFVDR